MENQTGKRSGSGATSKPSPRDFGVTVARWLAVFQAHYRQNLTPELFEIYVGELDGLTHDELNRGCRSCLRTSQFMPKISEILAAARPGVSDAILLAAERAWEDYQGRLQTYCCDDNGFELPVCRGGKLVYPPALDAATDYAVRQCGGRYAMEYGKPEELHFRRRDFIAAYVRHAETGGLAHLPLGAAALHPEIAAKVQGLLEKREA